MSSNQFSITAGGGGSDDPDSADDQEADVEQAMETGRVEVSDGGGESAGNSEEVFVPEDPTDLGPADQSTRSPTTRESGDSLDRASDALGRAEAAVAQSGPGRAAGEVAQGTFEAVDSATSTVADAAAPVTDPVVDASRRGQDALVEGGIRPTADRLRELADDRPGENVADTAITGTESLASTAVTSTVGLPYQTGQAAETAGDATGFVASELQERGPVEGTISSLNTGGDVALTASRAGAQAFRENPARTAAALGGAGLAGVGIGGVGAAAGRRAAMTARNVEVPDAQLSPRQQDVFETVRPRPGGETQTGDGFDPDRARQQDARPMAPGTVEESAGDVLDALEPQGSPDTRAINRASTDGPDTTSTTTADPPLRDEIAQAGGVRAYLRDEELPGQQIRPEELGQFGEFLADESAEARLVGRSRQRDQTPGDTQPEVFEDFANRRRDEAQQRSRALQSDVDAFTRPRDGGDSTAFPEGRVDEAQQQEVLSGEGFFATPEDTTAPTVAADDSTGQFGGATTDLNDDVLTIPDDATDSRVRADAAVRPEQDQLTDVGPFTDAPPDVSTRPDDDSDVVPRPDDDQEPGVTPRPEDDTPPLVPSDTPTPEPTPRPDPGPPVPRDGDRGPRPRPEPRLADDDEEERGLLAFVEDRSAATFASPILNADDVAPFGGER